MTANPPLKSQPNDGLGCDTDDLLHIHAVFRLVFGRMPDLVSGTNPADEQRVNFVEAHILEALEALHNHHDHEDKVLWQALVERAPESQADVERMQSHHESIAKSLAKLKEETAAWSQKPEEKNSLVAVLQSLSEELDNHLTDEENTIRPVAGRVIRQAEWNQMRDWGISEIPPDRKLFQLGLMIHSAPTKELREAFVKALPFPVRLLYALVAKRKFEKEWLQLYGRLD